MFDRRIAYLIVVGGLASGACSKGAGDKMTGAAGGPAATGAAGDPATTGSAGTGGTTAAPVDASSDAAPILFEEQARAIADEYLSWGRVDDELRWAPSLCRQPLPGIARQSTSDDSSTHGQKLYSVFAKNWSAYPNGPHDGQVVVKQSWTVEEATGTFNPGMAPPPNNDGDHFYPYAKGPDGGLFHAGAPAGLFIMFRLDPTTPETDEGWVYATVSPEGRVTSGGRVAACMNCHETSATHERLFGVPKSPGL
jgi:hypothetical protein